VVSQHVEAVLSKGDIFGEVSFLFGMRQTSNARTPHNMTATLFNLQKVDYMQVRSPPVSHARLMRIGRVGFGTGRQRMGP
jgi:CRP-like cAMP-binding protein